MTRSFELIVAVCLALVICVGARAGDEPSTEKNEALTVGQALPDFVSLDETGQAWKWDDLKGHKVVVFYFYPGDFTGGCIKQAESFREGLKSLEDLNITVVGVSGDEAATHQLFKQSHGLRHTLLADPDGVIAKQFGIPVRRHDKAAIVHAVGLDRKRLLDEQGKPITVERKVTYPRWTLIVDQEGKLVSKRTQVNPGTDADEVGKIVESLPIDARGDSRAGDMSK